MKKTLLSIGLLLLLPFATAIELNASWFAGLSNTTITNAFPSFVAQHEFVSTPQSMGWVFEYPTVYSEENDTNISVFYTTYNVTLSIPSPIAYHCLNVADLQTCTSILYYGIGFTFENSHLTYNLSGVLYDVQPIYWQNITYSYAEYAETLYLRDYVRDWFIRQNNQNDIEEVFV